MVYDVENEIEVLESLLSNLTDAMADSLESPYHKHLANSIEVDIEDVKARLDELYSEQNAMWAAETRQQNIEYERSIM